MPACEVKQEGRHGVVPVRSLEVGYKEVPADDGLHLYREVSDNPHLVLVRDIRLVFRNPHGCEVFLPERGQKEEVQHRVFIGTELAARDVGFENLFLGVLHRAFECDFLIALVLLLQFLHGRERCGCGRSVRCLGLCHVLHVTECNLLLPDFGIDGDFPRSAPAGDFLLLLHVVRPLLLVAGAGFPVAFGVVEIFGFGFFGAAWKGGVPVKGLHLVARSG